MMRNSVTRKFISLLFVTISFCLISSLYGQTVSEQGNHTATKAGSSGHPQFSGNRCIPVSGDIVQGFNGETFPPTCWLDNTPDEDEIRWARVTDGGEDTPLCLPKEGDGMTMLKGYFKWGVHGTLVTPTFLPNGENWVLSFWMYRNKGLEYNRDRLDVYLSEYGNIEEETPILTIHRSIRLTPVIASGEEGWQHYIVTLPCAGMSQAIVVFDGFGEGGGNIYLDDIFIGDYCMVPDNLKALVQEDNKVLVKWNTPGGNSKNRTGYNVYRDGVLIAENIDATEYADNTTLEPGTYIYSVETVYSNDCGLSEKAYAEPAIIVSKCPGLPTPLKFAYKAHVEEWYDINLTWDHPLGNEIGYLLYPASVTGFGAGGVDFSVGVRFDANDLTEYNGLKMETVSFIPREDDIDYIIKVWEGGNASNPGKEIYTQKINAADLEIGAIWNTITLTEPITIDASKGMWITVSYEGTKSGYYPAGCDNGLNGILRDGYSNLIYLEGEWVVMSSMGFSNNYAIKGYVKAAESDHEILGYNVYRDNELITADGIVKANSLRTVAPGPGTYAYEVSTIYDNYCESINRTKLTAIIPESPCDNAWEMPVREGFESSRFPAWCWTTSSADGHTWSAASPGGFYSVQPHSGESVLRSDNSGNLGYFISPLFVTEKDYTLSFWMYRSYDEYAEPQEKVNVYLSSSTSVAGLTPLISVYSDRRGAPVVEETGWYEYVVELNTGSMTGGAHIIFEAEMGTWGSPFYIDDVAVYDTESCDQIYSLDTKQPSEGIVELSWMAPLNTGLKGYRILRDDVVIVDNLTEPHYTDHTTVGTHKYAIVSLFNKTQCSESAPFVLTLDVFKQCVPVPEVTATQENPGEARIEWTAPDAVEISSYSVFRDDEYLEDTKQTFYMDESIPPGPHTYSIQVNYDTKECAESKPVFSNEIRVEHCVAVTDFKAEIVEGHARLSWKYGVTEEFPEVLFFEDFTNGIPEGWLNLDKDGDGEKWEASIDPMSGADVVYSTSFFMETRQPDNWLITPQITLSGTVSIEYYVGVQNDRMAAEKYGVFISTTGTAYDDFTMVFEETLSEAYLGLHQRELEIDGYSGPVYIAFRHFDCENQRGMLLTNIQVNGTWGIPTLYDVYKDDTLIETTAEMAFADPEACEAGKEYSYCVSPVYTTCVVKDCETLSIVSVKDPAMESISIYPNPASTQVTVAGKDIVRIEVYNVLGQLAEQITATGESSTIDLSACKPGIYIFKVYASNGAVLSKQIVITH